MAINEHASKHAFCRARTYAKQITATIIQSRYYVISHLHEHSKERWTIEKDLVLVTLTETWSKVHFVPLSKIND
jgi:hypothetical protein